jgi:GH35 family endo-1,4-beta-xylanase
MNELAKDAIFNLVKVDPEIDERIERGIEDNRKGWGEIELVGPDGQPLAGARIELRQVRHEFHFGANGFLHQQFEEQERNVAHDEAFKALFNLAVVPFYWSDLEPEQGKPRFAKDSSLCYRRPAIDLLLEFCESNGITPKGHPLAWQIFLPKWLPQDKPSMAACLEKRFAEIAARYGNRIKIWDVCNEAVKWQPGNVDRRMPDRHVEFAFELAAKYFPRTSVLAYNDFTCWDNNGDYTPFYMLCRHLKGLPVNFGAAGLQFHMLGFKKVEDILGYWKNQMLNPRHLLNCLDQYAKLGVPLNVSEVTLTAMSDLGDGLAFQREVAERLYRLWFSHEAMNGIIYWNLVDDTAYVDPHDPEWNENRFKGGLLNSDMTPKPAYEVLRRLIHEEWQTRTVLDYEPGGSNAFKGFYGDYKATIKTNAGTFTRYLKLSKGSIRRFKLSLG